MDSQRNLFLIAFLFVSFMIWQAWQTDHAPQPQQTQTTQNTSSAAGDAATSGVPNAKAAWDIFNSRPVKPDYSADPQWAVVPRQP